MVQSGDFTGMEGGKDSEGMHAVTTWLAERGEGRAAINYRLRDWLISRQRYWGNPIPAIHCESCGLVPVPESDLPVVLPMEVDITKGETLADHPGFYETTCPSCGGAAKRETDTMDTFTCSSWYYFRYSDARNDQAIWDKGKIDYWMPVDQYIGGIEHAILHLLYSRFFTKVFRDMGLADFDEPFTNLLTQGMVKLDGFTMSKSRGNVIPPEEVIERYGADTLRAYILFMAPPDKDLEWNKEGVDGLHRFLGRVWRLVSEVAAESEGSRSASGGGIDKAAVELKRVLHSTIAAVTEDIETFGFNTALARMMELVNAANEYRREHEARDAAVQAEVAATLVRLLAPFTPHFAEELWRGVLVQEGSVHREGWPEYDKDAAAAEEVELAVQVNGKVRGRLVIPVDLAEDEVKERALALENVAAHLEGVEVRKVVVVPGRLVSVVAG
jgi:leucyl-tRNA synthetase